MAVAQVHVLAMKGVTFYCLYETTLVSNGLREQMINQLVGPLHFQVENDRF
jgi:hypothetical protein